jgi:hypothetical protein
MAGGAENREILAGVIAAPPVWLMAGIKSNTLAEWEFSASIGRLDYYVNGNFPEHLASRISLSRSWNSGASPTSPAPTPYSPICASIGGQRSFHGIAASNAADARSTRGSSR